jgi:hypothetical protein
MEKLTYRIYVNTKPYQCIQPLEEYIKEKGLNILSIRTSVSPEPCLLVECTSEIFEDLKKAKFSWITFIAVYGPINLRVVEDQ